MTQDLHRSHIAFAALILMAAWLFSASPVNAQGKLTYPELMTALSTPVPNRAFQTKEDLIKWVVGQIRLRKVDKPMTPDRESDLRQAGAPDDMIAAIRESSPPVPIVDAPVDLGNLVPRAVNLVRPEYTEEARKARTMGEVKLTLELDPSGKVVSISRLSILPNGLTEAAIEAARGSTFRPAMRDGKPARGTGVLTFNFKLDVPDVATTLANANALRAKGEYSLAIADYSRILAVETNNAAALLGRGTCRLMSQEYEMAVTDLTAATRADPTDSEAFFYLAIAQDFLGDHAAGAANYQAASRLRPEWESRSIFTCLYIDRGGTLTPEQARSAAGKIVSACGENLTNASTNLASMIHFKRGIAHRMAGDHDKAISDLETAKRLNPKFDAVNSQLQVAYNGRGLEAFNKKDYKKAFDDVTRAINAEPNNAIPYINRCAVYIFGFKQYGEAINDCSSAIRLSARSASPYTYRGYAYEMTNNKERAIADYTKALELDPKNESARAGLSRLQPGHPTLKDN